MSSSSSSSSCVDSLLYEGYALYPYTPGAAKNSTPTPFGIVYPPALRGRRSRAPSTTSSCAACSRRRARRRIDAEVRFLVATASATGRARTALALPDASVGALAAAAARCAGCTSARPRSTPPAAAAACGAQRCSAHELDDGALRGGAARREPHLVRSGLDRAGALRALAALDAPDPARRAAGASSRRSSAHARASTPSRCSPATPTTPSLGAAIVLPDHPQIAPESRGGLFDSTEIEEALLLHVQRSATPSARRSSARTRRCARWSRAPPPRRPRRSLALHGRVTLRDPAPSEPAAARERFTADPPQEPAGPGRSDAPGEERPRSTACASAAAARS